jgi:hypothetical protein
MLITQQDLDSFHCFAQEKLQNGASGSMVDLARQWEIERAQREVSEALREAVEDFRAGRYRPAADVSRDLRRKYQLPGQ